MSRNRRGPAVVFGSAATVFSDDAITLIHNAARGYPRAVNNLAVHALTAAFAAKSSIATRNPPALAYVRCVLGVDGDGHTMTSWCHNHERPGVTQ